jgi:hypothetical protein
MKKGKLKCWEETDSAFEADAGFVSVNIPPQLPCSETRLKRRPVLFHICLPYIPPHKA